MASASDIAYEFIKNAVMNGELKAGDRIKEENIADAIGVSRTPIRNALRVLAAQGYIEMLHYQGARVADWSSQDLSEIIDLRALLEGFGAGTAAKKIDDETLKELRELASQMEDIADKGDKSGLKAMTDLNSKFHMKIIEASGNRRLAEVIGNLAHPLLMQRRFTAFNRERLHRSMIKHRDILDALASGDSEWAAAAMKSHILASKTNTQGHDAE